MRMRIWPVAAAAVTAAMLFACGQAVATEDVATLKAKYRRPPDIPFPADQSLYAGEGGARQGAVLRPAPVRPSEHELRELPQPVLRLGGAAQGRDRRAEHDARAQRADHPQSGLGRQALFLGRPRRHAGGTGHGSDPGGRRNEHARSGAGEAAGWHPGIQEVVRDRVSGEGVTGDNIARAIATYERTVVSGYAPFDAWVDGDENAISDAAKRGFVLFNGKANCAVPYRLEFHRQQVPRHRRRHRRISAAAKFDPRSRWRSMHSRRRACATSRSAHRSCTTDRSPTSKP